MIIAGRKSYKWATGNFFRRKTEYQILYGDRTQYSQCPLEKQKTQQRMLLVRRIKHNHYKLEIQRLEHYLLF